MTVSVVRNAGLLSLGAALACLATNDADHVSVSELVFLPCWRQLRGVLPVQKLMLLHQPSLRVFADLAAAFGRTTSTQALQASVIADDAVMFVVPLAHRNRFEAAFTQQ
jgi:hypothetical protein